MNFNKVFTDGFPLNDPYRGMSFKPRPVQLSEKSGSTVTTIIAPETWSQNAVDILATKYVRRAGVPEQVDKIPERGVPEPFWRSVPAADTEFGMETDARMVFNRLAGAWTYWAWKLGYFGTGKVNGMPWSEHVLSNEQLDMAFSGHKNEEPEFVALRNAYLAAHAFHDEVRYMLANQYASPASPQWFNTGLHWAYGITGPAPGTFYIDSGSEVKECTSAYERPLVHACFIQSVQDNLLGDYGIMDTWMREARVFKFGGGSGSNFSALRGKGEPLSGGGKSSGLLSWLGIGDRAAGAIKSGGTTRRAAKMVVVDADHPDIEDYVSWKVEEESKVAALAVGSFAVNKHMNAILEACNKQGDDSRLDVSANEELRGAIRRANADHVPVVMIQRAIDMARDGVTHVETPIYGTEWESKAYETVSGQNANNSVRLSNEFMHAVEKGEDWHLINRMKKDGKRQVAKTIKARSLWNRIGEAAWMCADPGLQFGTTINEWNTCPEDGEILATNPCGEYIFLDDTGCNLASLNLVKFRDRYSESFEIDLFKHATRIWTVILDVTVDMAGFPSRAIAKGSHCYRTLGLGYTNLGSLLMRDGYAYDSDEGRGACAAITCIMHSVAYSTSAEIASELGAFPRFENNKQHVLRVINNHHNAAFDGEARYDGLETYPCRLGTWKAPDYLAAAARCEAKQMLLAVNKYGVRNAQVTLCAPTGTIAPLMDCDTTGIEPDFALVKFKKLVGGGYFKIINEGVKDALLTLHYSEKEIEAIVRYAVGTQTLYGCPYGEQVLAASKLSFDEFQLAIPRMFDLSMLLDAKHGLTPQQYDEANQYIFGRMTVEGAPHLKQEHYAVFACANRCGVHGKQYIEPMAHLKMMAAAQPFLSGGISKTVNLPTDATPEQVKTIYHRAWLLMLKDVALYRDGSKLSQPLTTFADLGEVEPDQKDAAQEMTPRMIAERVIIRYLAKRRALPDKRTGYTQKVRIGGHTVYLRTGDYQDGSLGEIFVDMAKQGAAFRSVMNAFAIVFSLGLQHGVPLDEFVDALVFTRFEPNGVTQGHSMVKMCTSIIDFIVRDLAINYLGRTDLGQVNPEDVRHDAVHQPDETWDGEEEIIDRLVPVQEDTDDYRHDGSIKEVVYERTTVLQAKAKGYEGDPCLNCGEFQLVRAGACVRCDNCGLTSGCG